MKNEIPQRSPFRVITYGPGPSPFLISFWRERKSASLQKYEEGAKIKELLGKRWCNCWRHSRVMEPLDNPGWYLEDPVEVRAQGCRRCAVESLITAYCASSLEELQPNKACSHFGLEERSSHQRRRYEAEACFSLAYLQCWKHLQWELLRLHLAGKEMQRGPVHRVLRRIHDAADLVWAVFFGQL